MSSWAWVLVVVVGLLVVVAIHDVVQKKHAIVRNFPIVGHLRYLFELVGPELRQYIVTGNDEERPFSRDQRRWVYASSKKQNNYFGFGTDNDLEQTTGYLIVRHSAFPVSSPHPRLGARGAHARAAKTTVSSRASVSARFVVMRRRPRARGVKR